MEMWKRAGQGRLAEVLGAAAVPRDINARLLRYRGDMKAEYESYSPDTREILEAFTAGINAYIANLSAKGPGGLPIEFQLAGFVPTTLESRGLPESYGCVLDDEQCILRSCCTLKWSPAIGPDKAGKLLDLDPAVQLDPAPNIDFAGLDTLASEQLDWQRYAHRVSCALKRRQQQLDGFRIDDQER